MQPQNPTRARRSIRRYRPEPVPDSLLREVLEEGRWAPSSTNTQTTSVYVITGAALERVKEVLRGSLSRAEGGADLPGPASLPEPYQTRSSRLFRQRAAFVAAEEGGEPALPPQPGVVTPAALATAGVFGAPVLMVFALDGRLPTAYASFDAGLLVQNTALAAHLRGLGTCIMTSPLRFADALHPLLPGSDGQSLVAAMALGYPDPEAAVNRFPRERVSVDEFVTFLR